MNTGRGNSAIPAQGRNDNRLERVKGAAAEPFTRSFCSVMPGLTRHREIVLACALVFSLVASPNVLLAQAYFQQQVDYRIDVRLDDVKHELLATQEFDYLNNSPQTLDTIWIHLWPNAYKDRSSALCEQLDAQNSFGLHFATPEQRGSIDSLDFHSTDVKLTWGFDPYHNDIGWIKLPAPLATGSSITIRTPFHVKIPSARFSRLGHTGQAYYISQWFPKPAVYDAQGWHAMPYLTQGEFHSEFGSFDVRITLPANYVVGATGELQDAQEVSFMDSLAAMPSTFLKSAGGDPFPPSSSDMKTLHFKQDNVHDFAWFADKRFHVKKSQVTLARSGRRVTSWVLFTPKNAELWRDATTYVNESVRLYSEWVGDYPYSACTAVDGVLAAGGGMEYPMITLINTPTDTFELDVVIAHEVGHNWFYGMLGSNERDHPWMDEGINSFYEQRYVETRYPGRRIMDLQGIPLGFLTRHKGITYRQQNEFQYRFNARRNWDSPPDSPSSEFGMLDYGTTVYSKTALVFDQLREQLGQAAFDQAMQRYFAEWHFKHPYPQDLSHILQQETGKDLGWYFDTLIGTSRKVDLRRSSPDDRNKLIGAHVTDGHSPVDIDPRNDHGLRFLEVKFLAGLERADRKSIFWLPVIGKNSHDGWMPGLVLHNTTLPNQRFEWVAAPLFGTRSERLAGGARFMWNHDRMRSNILRNIHVGVSGFTASLWSVSDVEQWYQRVVPSIQFDLRSKPNAVQNDVRFRSVIVWNHAKGTYSFGTEESVIDASANDVFHEIRLHSERRNGLHPFDAQLISLHHDDFDRIALDARWSAVYDRFKHRVSFRAFGGAFLRKNEQQMSAAMGWRLHWGASDLLYDRLFLDRQPVGQNTSNQFAKDQGGFKTPTANGTSDTWIAAVNMETDLPFKLPLAFFASYGAAPFTSVTQAGRTTDWRGYWEMGIGVRILRDVVEMWVPLAYSKEIKDEVETLRGFTFTDRIRFVVALEKLDPTQALRRAPH